MTTPAPVTGSSIPTTVTDDAGNALKGTVVTVTGPGSYTGTATTDATTGVLQLTGLTVGDYTVSLNGRSAVIPVLPARAALGTAVQQAGAAVTSAQAAAAAPVQSVAGRTGAVVLASTDVSGLATVATSGSYADLTNKPSLAGLTPTATKTTAYTANAGEHVAVNATGGAVVVTLPTNPAVGTLVGAFKVDADTSTNQVTLLPAGGGTVDGDTTGAKFSTVHASAVLEHLGGNAWKVYISYPVTGPAGPTGATGPAGATGPQGATGATGAAGTNGTSSYLIPTSKTAAYTAAANDLVEADATSAGFTVTLPSPTAGTRVGVKKVDSTTNAVTVATTSGFIDGQATRPLSVQYASQIYIADGTNWQRLDTPQVTAIAATGTPSATTYLRGDGSWSTPAAGATDTYGWMRGDGSDGTITLDGTNTYSGITKAGNFYTLNKDVYALGDLTVTTGVTVTAAGYKLNATGLLIVASGALIINNAGTASGSSGGSAGPAGSCLGGGAGAAGTTTTAGAAGSKSYSKGGAGGAGGNGTGTGGTTLASSGGSGNNIPAYIDSTASAMTATSTWLFAGSFQQMGGGGGGGAGGGDSTNSGAGGGGGGGVIVINAKGMTNNGAIQARGGNGANATVGNTGGGGGGGGGVVWINLGQAATGTGTVDANGGSAGTGIGTGLAGTAGSAGNVRIRFWS